MYCALLVEIKTMKNIFFLVFLKCFHRYCSVHRLPNKYYYRSNYCPTIFFRGEAALSRPRSPYYRGFTITFRLTTWVGLLWKSNRPDAETST